MSTTLLPRRSAGVLRQIEGACEADLEPAALLPLVVEQLGQVVPLDAYFLQASDPETMLGLGAGVTHGMPHELCAPFWAFEFEVPDFNKFADLAREDRPVADLHAVTGGRPERSARWRELQPHGPFGAELRGAFRAGEHSWGFLQLNRDDRDGFTDEEVALVAAVAPLVGRALRRAALTQGGAEAAEHGPGMALLDAEHRLLSATPEAVAWFERIPSSQKRIHTTFGTTMPWEVVNVAQLARARASVARGAEVPPTRTRVRTGDGMWLLIHGSCLAEPDGRLGPTAIVVERAKAADVAPLIVQAYELTPRELDVTRAVARGLSTNEIAAVLLLSRYTVQDHLKRIYEKVGVASRGELVATMFSDHYHDRMEFTEVA